MKLKASIIFAIIIFLYACFAVIKSDPNMNTDLQPVQAGDEKLLLLVKKGGICIYTGNKRPMAEKDLAGKDGIIMNICISDLDSNGTDEILVLTGKTDETYGEDLLVISIGYNTNENGENSSILLKEIFRSSLKEFNPWKVQTCDVDGDGKRELSVGVFKTTTFHPVQAKRPFIYDWHGDRISPKWLGSRLSRPFDDYIFADINADGKDELISIELLEDSKKTVNSYAWKGFGFEGIGESKGFDDVSGIMKGSIIQDKGHTVKARIKTGNRWKWVNLLYVKDEFIIRR